MNALDRDAAREVLTRVLRAYPIYRIDLALDALEACVRTAPQQTIDRDGLLRYLVANLRIEFGPETPENWERVIDRILALLRPVDGVTLTREEAALCAAALDLQSSQRVRSTPDDRTRWALQMRLEAAS